MSSVNIQILKWLVLIILSIFIVGDNICQTPCLLSQFLCLIFKHLNFIHTKFYFRICYEVGIYWLFFKKMALSSVLTLLNYFMCFPIICNVYFLFLNFSEIYFNPILFFSLFHYYILFHMFLPSLAFHWLHLSFWIGLTFSFFKPLMTYLLEFPSLPRFINFFCSCYS